MCLLLININITIINFFHANIKYLESKLAFLNAIEITTCKIAAIFSFIKNIENI